jgi:cysteine sulfinate desulfinase/cysteine desulfurase-like protein
MGVDEDLALNAVRVSFGMNNTHQDVDSVLGALTSIVDRIPVAMRQVAV